MDEKYRINFYYELKNLFIISEFVFF